MVRITLLPFFLGLLALNSFLPHGSMVWVVLSLIFLSLLLYDVSSSENLKYIFVIGFSYGLGYFGGQLYWVFYFLYKSVDAGILLSTIAFIIFISFLSLYVGLFAFSFCYLKSGSRSFDLMVLFPSLWVLNEWLRGWLFTGFSWCDVAYTQLNGVFTGFFPIFGSYGVSWLFISFINAFCSCVILIAKPRRHPNGTSNLFGLSFRFNREGYRIPILVVMTTLIIGNVVNGISYTSKYGNSVTVALIQGNIARAVKWSSSDFLNIYKNLITKAKADIIIIPETAISSFSENLPRGYLGELVNIVKNKHAALITGIPKIIDKNNYVNSATLLTDINHPYYAKFHLVPFGEYIPFKTILSSIYEAVSLPMVGFSSGNANQSPMVVANQKLAFNICYENGFNWELINGAKNATIMANLSDLVWYGDTIAQDEHLQLSRARALENQRYFIQDTNTGITAIITPQGIVQQQLAPFTENTLTGIVYGLIGETPFERYGNYPVIMLSYLMLILVIIFKYKHIFKK